MFHGADVGQVDARCAVNRFSTLSKRALTGRPAQNDSTMMLPVRTAFVMEQALGHVTHYANVREFTDRQPDIAPVWLPVRFEPGRLSNLMPLMRSNWSVRASTRARLALQRTRARTRLDAIVFHTQVTSLFSVGIMRQIPTIVSMDATPINYDSVGEYYGHRPAGDGFVDRQKFELNRRAFQAASAIVTWCDWARRSLVSDYGIDDTTKPIRVVMPGAAAAYFEVGRRRMAALHTQTAARPVRILFVGGDFQRKGGPELLECVRTSFGDSCHLDIVTRDDVAAGPTFRCTAACRPTRRSS